MTDYALEEGAVRGGACLGGLDVAVVRVDHIAGLRECFEKRSGGQCFGCSHVAILLSDCCVVGAQYG